MTLVPKTTRIKAGHYEMRSGEMLVRIRRMPNHWRAKPVGRTGHLFRTKREASEWAHDWLTEHA